MPIPKTELNKRRRAERKAAQMVEVRVWVREADAAKIRALESKLNARPVLYVAPIAKGTGDGSSEESSMSIAGALHQDYIGFEECSKNPHVWSFNTVDNTAPISGNTFLEGDKPESVGG